MIWLFVFWLLGLIFGFFFIFMTIVSGVLRFTRKQEQQRRQKRIHCIKKGKGTIVDLHEDKTKRIMLVEVKIKGTQDVFLDEIKPLSLPRRFLGIKIGKKYCYPANIRLGNIVDIQYNPKDCKVGYVVY